MSHFTVLVIGSKVEEQLAPYEEGLGNGDNWDWYVIGGRWTGYFKMKEGKKGVVGEPGVLTDAAEEGYADQAKKKDIDFVFMRNAAAERAGETYDKIIGIIGQHLDGYIPWEKMRDEVHAGDIDAARAAYAEQPAVKALEAEQLSVGLFGVDVDTFLCTREGYVQKARNRAIATYAFVKDGEWYEKGTMGWWGVSSNEMDEDEWLVKFNEMLDSLPDNTLLTVVDCHI